MKIEINLLSDLCMYSGETYNSVVDMDVVYDENGITYIPAKRIKGCMRETALEMKELGIISDDKYVEIFGKEGNQNSKFTLSNAYIKDYDKTVAVLKQCKYKGLVSPQNVLNQYTYTRTQTSVDLETGVADKNSLRTVRVVKKGLKFEAEFNCEKKYIEFFKTLFSLVKHMGVSRTRGLGLVDIQFVDYNEEKHVFVEDYTLSNMNKINYEIKLNSSMICKSPKGNQAVTQDYIAGSKVLGFIAGQMGDAKYQNLIKDKELIVSNAYIMNGEKRCIPGKVSWQKEKDQSYDEKNEMTMKDMLYEPDVKKMQMTPANISYIDEDRNVLSVETEISYHHQRPNDKSVGRATGKDGSSFYQLASISAGQTFGGSIYADKEQAEQIIDTIKKTNTIRMGYGKSSEFGAIDFTLKSVEPVVEKTQKTSVNEAEVTLISDVILYNSKGMLSTDIQVLKEYLQNVLSVEDLEIKNPFLRFETVGGFNFKWQRRKPTFNALGKGSACIIDSKQGFDIELLKNQFIGERVSEGYGEIFVKEVTGEENITVRKVEEQDSQSEKIEVGQSDLIQEILQCELKNRLQCRVRELLEQKQNVYLKNKEDFNAAVSKLRVIFKNEKSYEGMKKQVEELVDSDKSKLCKELIQIVIPKDLEVEALKEINNDYDLEFENRWSPEKLYKEVYKAYITELKQLAKDVKKGRG